MPDKEKENSVPEIPNIPINQITAVLWLVATNGDVEVSAAQTGVTVHTLRAWMREEPFKAYYERIWSIHLGIGTKKRQGLNKFIASEFYREIMDRISSGGLKNLTVNQLIVAIKAINVEMRMPDSKMITPGAEAGAGVPSADKEEKDDLKARFANSVSRHGEDAFETKH